ALAHVDQPLRGGDDAVRGASGGAVSGLAPRPRLFPVLAVALSGGDEGVAQLQERAALGRRRGRHLRNGVAAVLVPGAGAGPGGDARPRAGPAAAQDLRRLRARVARLRAALPQVPDRVWAPGWPRDAAGDLGAQHRVVGLRDHPAARLALDDLSTLLRGGRDLLRLRHGADADGAGAALL